jgi:uncharacterized small protein (DUF1192 family)
LWILASNLLSHVDILDITSKVRKLLRERQRLLTRKQTISALALSDPSKASMSVKELQARIDKLAADIDLQKTVLQQLEQSKSAAQRQLNAICDPMTRLPPEISSAIFLLCLPHSHPKPTPRTAPMLLLRVCHAWAEIAVSTPALWVAIRVDVLGVKFLQAWLQRARNYPLSISLRQSFNSRIGILLRQYAKQLKHLKIYDEELDDLDSLTDLESFPCLETLLRRVCICQCSEGRYIRRAAQTRVSLASSTSAVVVVTVS